MEDKVLDYFDEFEDDVRIVVAKHFSFESEAYLYAARLKEEHIPSFISNGNIGTVLPMGAGVISLHIREKDVPAANLIIQELDQQKSKDNPNQSFHDADLDDIKYQQTLIQKNNKPDWVILSIIIVIVLIVIRAYLRASGWLESWRDVF